MDPLLAWIIAICLVFILLYILNWLFGTDPSIHRRKTGFTCFVTFFINNNLKVGGFMAEKTFTGPAAGTQFFGHIDPKFNGAEVEIQEDSEVYSSSDESIFTVVQNPKNPRYFIGTLTGKVGKATLQIAVDDDPGAGDVPFNDIASISVLPGLANDMGTTFDDTDDAPDTRTFKEVDYSDSTHAIIIEQSGALPEKGETVLVDGDPSPTSGDSTYTLTDGAVLVVDADSLVVSYTPAATA